MKAINIQWDTDENVEIIKDLSTEMIIPDKLAELYKEDAEYALEEIAIWLSEKIGFCCCGFELID